MATQVQWRGGSTAEHATFTGAAREVTVDTQKKTLVVHDGSTAGGVPLLRENQSNLPTTAPTTGIYNASGSLAISTGGSGRLFVDASGRIIVGAATAAIGIPLEIVSNAPGLAVGVRGRSADNIGIIGFYPNNSSTEYARIQSNGDSSLSFGTGPSGSERLRITSAGLVGVGTSSPSQRLHVVGTVQSLSTSTTVADNVGFFAGNGGDGSLLNGITFQGAYLSNLYFGRSALADDLVARNGSAELFRITNGGRVGIGTTSPAQLLHLKGSGDTKLLLNSANNASDRGIYFATSTDSEVLGYIKQEYATGQLQISSGTGTYSSEVAFRTSGSERAKIDISGRLLVGTSSASYASTIVCQGNSGSTSGEGIVRLNRGTAVPTSGQTLGAIIFGQSASNDGAYILGEADAAWSASNDYPTRLVFSTTADGASSPTERMRIGSSGSIGIGIADDATIKLYSAATGSQYAGYFTFPGATGQGIGIKSTGVSTANPIYFFNNNTLVGSVSTTSSSTAYNTSSDYRLKENVTAVTDGITRLQQLKPSRFNFKVEPGKTVDGFIAHEVQAVIPEAVTGTKDEVDADGNPKYQGIDQSKLVPLLTAALQEAVAKIESLEARLTAAGI